MNANPKAVPMPTQELALDLPMSLAAPALARRALDDLRLGEPLRENALLAASELVSNALRHSGADAGAAIRLRATLDAGSRREPGVGGGFGLFLVARLADAWGIERTTVWCELTQALPAATAPHPASESRHAGEHGKRHDDEHAKRVER